jgi:DNA-binding SARP family transcriptional activator
LKAPQDGCTIALLGGFQVHADGASLSLPLGAQRLLALLALEDGVVDRSTAIERLWPDSPRGRAAANLRSALWRGRHAGAATLIDGVGPRLHLAAGVRVDLHELRQQARQIAIGASSDPESYEDVINGLSRDLLPAWSDDWLLPERERWDQVRLHALETLAQQFLTTENYLSAMEAALAAVGIEPIRESAHRIVLKVHVAEGNSASALKHYQRYRALLQLELGVTPSRQMDEIIHPLASAWRRPKDPR